MNIEITTVWAIKYPTQWGDIDAGHFSSEEKATKMLDCINMMFPERGCYIERQDVLCDVAIVNGVEFRFVNDQDDIMVTDMTKLEEEE